MAYSVSDIKPCYNDRQQITSLTFSILYDERLVGTVEISDRIKDIASVEPITFHKLAKKAIDSANERQVRSCMATPSTDLIGINSFKSPSWLDNLIEVAVSDIRSNFLTGADLDILKSVIVDDEELCFIFESSRSNKTIFDRWTKCSAALDMDDLEKSDADIRAKINLDLGQHVCNPEISDELFEKLKPYCKFYLALNNLK